MSGAMLNDIQARTPRRYIAHVDMRMVTRHRACIMRRNHLQILFIRFCWHTRRRVVNFWDLPIFRLPRHLERLAHPVQRLAFLLSCLQTP